MVTDPPGASAIGSGEPVSRDQITGELNGPCRRTCATSKLAPPGLASFTVAVEPELADPDGLG